MNEAKPKKELRAVEIQDCHPRGAVLYTSQFGRSVFTPIKILSPPPPNEVDAPDGRGEQLIRHFLVYVISVKILIFREASNRENNDVYSNGYERVNNGFCRKIKMCKWFKRRRKRNTPSTIESKAKTDVLHHIVVDNNLVPPVEVPSVRTPVSLRRNRGFSPARYLWRSFRPSIAPRLSNRSQEASDHVYSEGVFYNVSHI